MCGVAQMHGRHAHRTQRRLLGAVASTDEYHACVASARDPKTCRLGACDASTKGEPQCCRLGARLQPVNIDRATPQIFMLVLPTHWRETRCLVRPTPPTDARCLSAFVAQRGRAGLPEAAKRKARSHTQGSAASRSGRCWPTRAAPADSAAANLNCTCPARAWRAASAHRPPPVAVN